MHLLFWALIASLYFFEVTSLPIHQSRSLDENHGIKDRNFVRRTPAPGEITARFLARGKDQSDNKLVDYVQNALGYLKISARVDSGDGLAQSSGCFIHQDWWRKAVNDFNLLLSPPFVLRRKKLMTNLIRTRIGDFQAVLAQTDHTGQASNNLWEQQSVWQWSGQFWTWRRRGKQRYNGGRWK